MTARIYLAQNTCESVNGKSYIAYFQMSHQRIVFEDTLEEICQFAYGAVGSGNPQIELVNGIPEELLPLSCHKGRKVSLQPIDRSDITWFLDGTGILDYYPALSK